MAVVGLAKPIAQGRPGEDAENGLKIFMRTYLVQTDSPTDGPNVVLGAPGLPKIRDPYDGHPSAVCIRRVPQELANTPFAWHVTCEWSTHSVDRDENPLNTRPDIEWGFEAFEEPIVGTPNHTTPTQIPNGSGQNGEPVFLEGEELSSSFLGWGILNAAGDPYDPPPTRTNYYPVIRFTRNEESFDAATALHFGDTVNLTDWCGLAPRQAWLKPIEASHEVQMADGIDQPDILYWRVRYTFVLKAYTWDLLVLNQGYRYLDKPNTTTTAPFPKKIPFDNGGRPYIDLLKTDGTRYAANEKKVATYGRYRVIREVDFKGLNINISPLLVNLNRRRGRVSGPAGVSMANFSA